MSQPTAQRKRLELLAKTKQSLYALGSLANALEAPLLVSDSTQHLTDFVEAAAKASQDLHKSTSELLQLSLSLHLEDLTKNG